MGLASIMRRASRCSLLASMIRRANRSLHDFHGSWFGASEMAADDSCDVAQAPTDDTPAVAVSLWDAQQVIRWVRSLPLEPQECSRVAAVFARQAVDGAALVELSAETLRCLDESLRTTDATQLRQSLIRSR